MTFRNDQERHEHSLQTLNTLAEYDDFMESIGTLVDLGCGTGLDLEWWATRTTREDAPQPLNIRCTGVDIAKQIKKWDSETIPSGLGSAPTPYRFKSK